MQKKGRILSIERLVNRLLKCSALHINSKKNADFQIIRVAMLPDVSSQKSFRLFSCAKVGQETAFTSFLQWSDVCIMWEAVLHLYTCI